MAADEDREVLKTVISETKNTVLYTCAVPIFILKLVYAISNTEPPPHKRGHIGTELA